jgi:hypothetical protein
MLKIANMYFNLLNIFYLHWNVHEILGLSGLNQVVVDRFFYMGTQV